MLRVFTEYVRRLGVQGEPPDPELVAGLWTGLRAALRSELRRRGLWDSPPSYLGVPGSAWEELGEGDRGGALEELAAECYAFIFVDRLRSLAAQLAVKPNVDGLVFLNLRHFLHERQREHDPLGYRVYEILRLAVQRALAAGELYLISGDPGVRNDTVLGFRQDPAPQAPADLRRLIADWNDALLAGLGTARGRRQEAVADRLRGRLPELAREGVEAFRFRDLIDPLKADARARWAAVLQREQGELAAQAGAGSRLSRIVRPDTQYEEEQSFARLTSCVTAAVDRLEADARTRRYLADLWTYVRGRADESALLASDPGEESGGREGARLSHRRIAERLGIPRERLPELFAMLGRLVEQCRKPGTGGRATNKGKP